MTNAKDKAAEGKAGKKGGRDKDKEVEKTTSAGQEPVIVVCSQLC